jgi:L-ribulose-5-phosphate 3-epimerase
MFLGYNTNGFAHHRLEDAFEIIANLGYASVALTLDVHHLDPIATDDCVDDLQHRINVVSEALHFHKLKCVIETGARFLLDRRAKHQPTLLSPDADDRYYRYAFLQESVGIASQLNSKIVSFWSGAPTDDATPRELMLRLVDGCRRLADAAASLNVRLAFEPEPGMFIDTMDKFAELQVRVNHPNFGLTIDVGHLVCNGELPVSKYLQEWKHVLWNVHIEDMKRGVHDHLMFGEGEVDFADVFAGLREANYLGGVYVELSRHSYDAVNVARKAKALLDPYIKDQS